MFWTRISRYWYAPPKSPLSSATQRSTYPQAALRQPESTPNYFAIPPPTEPGTVSAAVDGVQAETIGTR